MTETIGQILADLGGQLTGSPVNRFAVYVLGNVPGLPPLVQTVHILSVAAIMGSIVLVDLRVLGLALPSQPASELTRRLMPWVWWALPCLALSGLLFVFARPRRYFVNPVLGVKFALLLPAVVLAFAFHRLTASDDQFWERTRLRRTMARAIAACSLCLWVGVVLAGRWVAYADYLFPPE